MIDNLLKRVKRVNLALFCSLVITSQCGIEVINRFCCLLDMLSVGIFLQCFDSWLGDKGHLSCEKAECW